MPTMKFSCASLINALKSAAEDPEQVSPIAAALFQGAAVDLSVSDAGAVSVADAGPARPPKAKPTKRPPAKKAAKKAAKTPVKKGAKKSSRSMVLRKRR